MAGKYQPKKIETKWQKYWEEKKVFVAKENQVKKKFYALIEFPYPSGDGLHTGHLRSNTAMDIISRKRRMEGYEVLYPIGFDSFGLPAENYAVKKGIAPQITTKKNIETFTRQLKSSGFSFDWSRSFSTTDEEYYVWTQWIFIQMFKQGLAYKAKENINWCTSCKIGLANEEVVNGVCERCGGKVVKKEKEQWMLKITKYADRLIKGLDKVDFLPQIKQQQINWIGKSEGVDIVFKVKGKKESGELKIFTTRPDTLFGATFMAIAPEHNLITKFKDEISNWVEVDKYIKQSKKKTETERADLSKDKTGVELKGIKAINPANNESLPIYVADYILTSYGYGAIMAVPAHDERDFAFAKKYKLPIVSVIYQNDGIFRDTANVKSNNEVGYLKNSAKFNDLSSQEAAEKITKEFGVQQINYKLRDWIFSRQRYWGEPIPMVYCEVCQWQPVPEKDLPIKLPKIKDFLPTENGDSPLAKVDSFVKTKCPKCGGQAKRETDVMPNWAGSNWYFVRYTDPKNKKVLADPNKIKYWLPVDWYNGGMEHTTLHLLYSRFIFKFLYDIKVIPKSCGDEPYVKRTAHGLILGEGGVKMSKSKGNVVNPDDYVNKFGADTLRVYEMFVGPFDQAIPWDDKGVIGVYRFLNKVWELQTKVSVKADNKNIESLLNQTIKKVGEDIDQMKFNTAVSQLMILANTLDKENKIAKAIWEKFLLILAPFAPHICEELWLVLGHKKSLARQAWPEYDQKLAQAELINLAIQINGKVRDQISLPHNTEDNQKTKEIVLSQERVAKEINNRPIKKYIHIKNRIISIVV